MTKKLLSGDNGAYDRYLRGNGADRYPYAYRYPLYSADLRSLSERIPSWRKKSFGAVLCYLGIGACGLPVFSGMQGGIGILITGFTGGFLWGFIPLAIFCGIGKLQAWKKNSKVFALSLGALGVLICHVIGVAQLSAVSSIDLISAFLVGSLPYLLKDVLSMAGAYFFSATVRKRLGKSGIDI
ncbi:MAG: biotin transporter BioY [Ruminococcaceae bacterium]|nr:biotin transporter BioY [Oscillospiraceae bacterium]